MTTPFLDPNAADIQALGAAASPGSSPSAASANHVHPSTGVVLTSEVGAASGVASLDGTTHVPTGQIPQLADYAPTGLTGATAASRYVGATTSAAPVSGTFAKGDWVIDQTGAIWVCTTAGSPGTWTEIVAGAGGPPSGSAGGDLGSSYPNPTVVATHLASALPIAQGGTAAVTAAAALASLGALPVAGGTMTGWLAPAVAVLTDASTVMVNAALGNVFTLLTTSGVGATRAIGAPSNPVDGQVIRFRITQAASGGPYAVTWNAAFDFGSGSSPTQTATASKTDIYAFEYVATNSLNKWCYLGAAIPQGF